MPFAKYSFRCYQLTKMLQLENVAIRVLLSLLYKFQASVTMVKHNSPYILAEFKFLHTGLGYLIFYTGIDNLILPFRLGVNYFEKVIKSI